MLQRSSKIESFFEMMFVLNPHFIVVTCIYACVSSKNPTPRVCMLIYCIHFKQNNSYESNTVISQPRDLKVGAIYSTALTESRHFSKYLTNINSFNSNPRRSTKISPQFIHKESATH